MAAASLPAAGPSSLDALQTDPRMPVRSSSSSALPPSRFYIAFKVLQLVRVLRNNVKTRQASTQLKRERAAITDDFCQESERLAYEHIDQYLGRKARRTKVTGEEKHLDQTTSLKSAQNRSLPSRLIDGCNLLFVTRKSEFHVRAASVKELSHLLETVTDLIDVVRDVTAAETSEHASLESIWTDCTHSANLEHLLLCLEGQLVGQLIAACVELVRKHIDDCQKNQGKYDPAWFFEFPDARHPLSTTWPWNIRPSLAVLWGVCWMFFDFVDLDWDWNIVDEHGHIIVPREIVLAYSSAMANQPQRQQRQHQQHQQHRHQQQQQLPSANPMSDFAGLPQPIGVAGTDPAQAHARPRSSATAPRQAAIRGMPPSHRESPSGDWLAHSCLRLGVASSNNACAAPPAYAHAPNAADQNFGWVPQDLQSAESNLPHNATDPLDGRTWTTDVDQSPVTLYIPSDSLPPPSQSQSAPSIRVPPGYSPSQAPSFHQPQESIYSQSPHFPYYDFSYNNYQLGSSGPRVTPYPMPQGSDMETPDSSTHHSPRDPAALDSGMPRKRSHSVMSQAEVHATHPNRSRSTSLISPADPSPTADYSPRGSRSRRRDDPPVNADNKYYCDVSDECQGRTFDRKCEWSKHMDKHNRPYRCPDPACAKLQGFTYSGGLLRHEREVHNKHGGPKAQLMCPHVDCKRHEGKGFTRKENLNEHLRRVHPPKGDLGQIQLTQAYPFRTDGPPPTTAFEDAETPISRISEISNYEEPPAMSPGASKRRRLIPESNEHGVPDDVEDVHQELHRLRSEALIKDERVRQMEALASQQQEKIRALEQAMQQVHQHAGT